MHFHSDGLYHIYNRGNQKQIIFFNDENYRYFLKKMRKELTPYCDILSYCLMPNHFHWLVKIKPNYSSDDFESSDELNHPLSKGIAVLLRSYTRAIQKQENFTGSLFQQKTKSKEIIDERQLLTCANYIHQNPVNAKLVGKMENWQFSSFQDYCEIRNGNLCNRNLFYELTGIDPKTDFYTLSYNSFTDEQRKLLF